MTTKTLPKRAILFDHDGSADDFLSLVLLLTMKEINLLGISITPADCFLEDAISTTLKILSIAKKKEIEISTGRFHGINAFPVEWRAKPKILNALPDLVTIDTPFAVDQFKESTEMFAQRILTSKEPVSILMTGPCTNLVHALDKTPAIKEKIEEIVWMGGAVDVEGNVKTYNHAGTAEWNVYWDPIASNKLLQHKLPLTIIPLDACNQVPVSIEFLKQLSSQSEYLYSRLAGQFWATTIDTIPSYEYIYFMWDVLATSYLDIPEAFVTEEMELNVHPTGPNSGNTERKKGTDQWVKVAKSVNKSYFYDYLLKQFKYTP
ncbi:nucleoside hydrolase [Xanthovirga aplysinae]|uniref:nucleoside hydrolase n=1 Tax=Xanthovirga aplysinae TaxID=2529853 RepID=UPI0012BD5245|nr:nucleoside hydrolase [Xanthovirga aplysinae]MTI31527.1 nucleoside hydrolase [Xanthovirga aplysinae]